MSAAGRCLCGQVSFEIERGVEHCLVSYNHARGYRDWTGAAFFSALLAPSSVVKINDSHGSLKTYTQGPTLRQFCGACGTPICCKTSSGNKVELNRGIMYQTTGKISKPMFHIQCAEGLPEVLNAFQDGLERFPALPDPAATQASQKRLQQEQQSEMSSTFQAPHRQASQQTPPPPPPPPAPAQQSSGKDMPSRMASSSSTSTTSSVYPPPPAAPSSQQRQLLRLHSPHLVDENDLANKTHEIISVPCDNIVELVKGDLQNGLGGEYSEYVEVLYNGRVGKVSRKVVTSLADSPSFQAPPPPPPPPSSSSSQQSWSNQQPRYPTIPPNGSRSQYTPSQPPPPPTADSGPVYVSQAYPSASYPPQNPQSMPSPPPAIGGPGSISGSLQQSHQQQQQQSEFMPAYQFQGPRPGYVYKNAERGLGYYKDVAPNPPPRQYQQQPQQPEPPAMGSAPSQSNSAQRSGPPGVSVRRF